MHILILIVKKYIDLNESLVKEGRQDVHLLLIDCLTDMTVNIDTHVEVVLVQNTVVHVYSGHENDHLDNRPKRPHFIQNKNYLPKRPPFWGQNGKLSNYRLMDALIHSRTVIIPRDRYRPEGFTRGSISVEACSQSWYGKRHALFYLSHISALK
jgi:hypothetical protein